MPENFDDAKGKVKETAGDLTDNDRLKGEGKVDQAKGGLKGALGDVADKAKEAIGKDDK